MPLEINAHFRKFAGFALQRANPATSKAIARMGFEGPLGGRAIKAAAVAVATVALASCAQVPGDAGANADAARGLRFGHWPTNSTESITSLHPFTLSKGEPKMPLMIGNALVQERITVDLTPDVPVVTDIRLSQELR